MNMNRAGFFRAQLQQLESRLRYSRTDKETAEKKQRILIDKDLVDFKEKLDAYDVNSFNRSFFNIHSFVFFQPKIKALQSAIADREKRISKLRVQKNKIEDAIFADFCKQIHVANIR